nr:DNA helicase [Tanacetum cinerariifolium]
MRLKNKSLSEIDKHRTTTFAQWLLDVGNGQIGIPDDSDPDNTSWVDIPDEYCIPDDDNVVPNLINFIYDADTLHYPSAQKLQEKAIVCPKNDTADIINDKIQSLLTTTTRTYLSHDDAIPHTHDGGEIELLYPKEYLNSLSFPGLPPHNLTLKVGSPIMLLRNMNIAGGLCNGTRLIGIPIQANMDSKDTEYFDQLLQLHSAYRITGFSCEQTLPWERTLDNPTSFTFGKYISVQAIPNTDFPEHYFNFVAYNELPAKVNAKNPLLTDFAFDSGNIIQLALWHELALTFNITEYEAMEKPVILAVTSCWVRRFNGLQLSGTSATHYYLNPNIPKTYNIKEHNQVDSLIKDCNELLAELSDKNPYNLPSVLKELEGTTHIFQFHFDTNSTTRKKDFVLDTVFTNTRLSVPTPTIEHAEPKPISPELPQPVILTEAASPTLSTTVSNQFDPQLNITSPSQQLPIRLGQPGDRVIQSTPPQIENPTEAHKGNKPTNPTAPSARKALFKDTSQIEFPQFFDFLFFASVFGYFVIYPWLIIMGSYRSKEDGVSKISTSIYVTNLPETFFAKDLFHSCKVYGHVVDSFIPLKRSKDGKRFGFVRFINVFSVERLVSNLCTIWVDRFNLHANVAHFNRPYMKDHLSFARKGPEVRAKEVPGWIPEFLEESDEDVFSDEGIWNKMNDGGEVPDINEVPATDFEEIDGLKVEHDGNSIGQASKISNSDSIGPGRFKKSVAPCNGGSILSLMEEVVRVGQTMGYKRRVRQQYHRDY